MKKLILSLAIAFGVSAHALSPVEPSAITDPAVKGRWISKVAVFVGNGMEVFFAFDFGDLNGSVSSVCKFQNGKVLEASVTVPMDVGGGKIKINGKADAEVKEGSLKCNVWIEPGTVGYSILAGPVLRMNADGHVLDFARR